MLFVHSRSRPAEPARAQPAKEALLRVNRLIFYSRVTHGKNPLHWVNKSWGRGRKRAIHSGNQIPSCVYRFGYRRNLGSTQFKHPTTLAVQQRSVKTNILTPPQHTRPLKLPSNTVSRYGLKMQKFFGKPVFLCRWKFDLLRRRL